ncbi:MAG: acetylxylan esterase [Kiritimatiellae bacterium]|nr:acetylxylan esterase [Kiritimatiellia bacterium]
MSRFYLSLILCFCVRIAFAQWAKYLDPPKEYISFAQSAEKIASYDFPGFSVEEYRQANGPGTHQRVMMAVPKDIKGRLPAVVVPFYYPEAMLGFDPKTGGVAFPYVPSKTNLTYFSEISYMSDLAKRGYVTISADAYYLTYAAEDSPKSKRGSWGGAGRKLKEDYPSWTGMGKLVFDTRLLVDFISGDPRVDSGRIGIIGHSLGGKMAFYAGCLDRRIKVIVASDFGICWDQTNWKDIWYWGEALNEVRAKGMEHSGLLSLSGGKPFCLIAGETDDEKSEMMMRRAKGYENDPESLVFINHATGHRPPRNVTEIGYRFLDRYLKEVK